MELEGFSLGRILLRSLINPLLTLAVISQIKGEQRFSQASSSGNLHYGLVASVAAQDINLHAKEYH